MKRQKTNVSENCDHAKNMECENCSKRMRSRGHVGIRIKPERKRGPKAVYADKLLDPRWQKKRLEIMKSAEFACETCGDKKQTLHVHHQWYGDDPWDCVVQPDEFNCYDTLEANRFHCISFIANNYSQFVCLCSDCHKIIHGFNRFQLDWIFSRSIDMIAASHRSTGGSK